MTLGRVALIIEQVFELVKIISTPAERGALVIDMYVEYFYC